MNAGKPEAGAAVTPTGPNEPPRTDQPSQAPLHLSAPESGTGRWCFYRECSGRRIERCRSAGEAGWAHRHHATRC